MRSAVVTLLAAAQLASAHFGLIYPEWRVDTLAEENEELYSQWEYPCAGANTTANRTEWPTTGGAVELELHHPWAYVFINIGLGTNTTNFNISLTPDLWNVSGTGSFCYPKFTLPTEIPDGTNATMQVVTSGASGSALYNCADITFRTDAPAHECSNSTEFNITILSDGDDVTPGVDQGAASAMGFSVTMLSAAVGLAVVFATAM